MIMRLLLKAFFFKLKIDFIYSNALPLKHFFFKAKQKWAGGGFKGLKAPPENRKYTPLHFFHTIILYYIHSHRTKAKQQKQK
jgi:hypothetical protein